MVEVKGTTIAITRGDSAILQVQIFEADGSEYVPVEGDVVRFALKKNYNDPEPLLVKQIPITTMELLFMPEDTKGLEFGPIRGRYKYDVELTRASGLVDTFIPRADFIVLEEVL